MWQDQAYPQDSDLLGKDSGYPQIFQTDNKLLQMLSLKKIILIEKQNSLLFKKQRIEIQPGCWAANAVPPLVY